MLPESGIATGAEIARSIKQIRSGLSRAMSSLRKHV